MSKYKIIEKSDRVRRLEGGGSAQGHGGVRRMDDGSATECRG